MSQENDNSDVLHFTPNSKKVGSSINKSAINFIWWFLGFVFFAFLVLLVIALRHQPQTQSVTFDPQSASVLSSLSPEVSVKKPSEQEFRVIDASEPVSAGTEITTGAGAQAVIFSGDGILTTLKPNSRVILRSNDNENNQTRLELLAGGLWARVDSALGESESYEVQAGDTVTAVRGTEFEITSTSSSINVSAVRDEVAVETRSVDSSSNFASTTILSGQQVSIPSSDTAQNPLAVSEIPAERLRDLVNDHADVIDITDSLTLSRQAAIMDGVPVLADAFGAQATSSESQEGAVEEFGESLYGNLFAQNPKKQARFHLLQAQEQLQKVDADKTSEDTLSEILQKYQSSVVQASEIAESANSSDLQKMVARSTRLFAQSVSAMSRKASDFVQGDLRQARKITEASHQTAVSSLATTSPQEGYKEISRSMNAQLAGAQAGIANTDEARVRDNLRDYDRFTREAGKVSASKNSQSLPEFANQLRKNLTAFESSGRLNDNLSPGIRRTINEVRDRTINSQTAALAQMATSSPEAAVDIYEKTTDYYVGQVDNSSNSEEVSRSIAAVNKYSSFGSKMASISDPITVGTSTVQDKIKEIAQRQEDRLESVSQQVPEQAQQGLQQAIENQQRIQESRPVNQPNTGRPDEDVGPGDNTGSERGVNQGSDVVPGEDVEPGEGGQDRDVRPDEDIDPTEDRGQNADDQAIPNPEQDPGNQEDEDNEFSPQELQQETENQIPEEDITPDPTESDMSGSVQQNSEESQQSDDGSESQSSEEGQPDQSSEQNVDTQIESPQESDSDETSQTQSDQLDQDNSDAQQIEANDDDQTNTQTDSLETDGSTQTNDDQQDQSVPEDIAP